MLVAILEGRELEVVRLFARGEDAKAIALRRNLSAKTVDTHRATSCGKLTLYSMAELTKHGNSPEKRSRPQRCFSASCPLAFVGRWEACVVLFQKTVHSRLCVLFTSRLRIVRRVISLHHARTAACGAAK